MTEWKQENKTLPAIRSQNVVADLSVPASAFDNADYIVTYYDGIVVTE